MTTDCDGIQSVDLLYRMRHICSECHCCLSPSSLFYLIKFPDKFISIFSERLINHFYSSLSTNHLSLALFHLSNECKLLFVIAIAFVQNRALVIRLSQCKQTHAFIIGVAILQIFCMKRPIPYYITTLPRCLHTFSGLPSVIIGRSSNPTSF